jgi:hypothetical protein
MGVTRCSLALLLVSACLSEPTGDGGHGLGVDPHGVRLIGDRNSLLPASSCEILVDCCQGDSACLAFVDNLTESACADLLAGSASECLGGSGDGGCCQANDPCSLSNDGSCECPDQFWDQNDCSGVKVVPDAEPDCCSPGDPCGWANDGYCDCPGEAWEASDCAGPEPGPDASVPPDAPSEI